MNLKLQAKRTGFSLSALIFGTMPALASGGVGGEISPFIYLLSIFVMAIFVGYYVVWSVTPALHTPLMAVTNAISSVIVVGALLAVGVSAFAKILAPPDFSALAHW